MGKPIIQEDIDMIETLNIPNIIKVYKYILLIGSIIYGSYLMYSYF